MKRKPEKIQAYWDSNPDLCDTSAVPVQVEIEMNCCKNMPETKTGNIFNKEVIQTKLQKRNIIQ